MGTDVRSDPRVAAILNDPTLHPRDKEQRLDALNAQTGYQLWPKGYGLNIGTGEIYKDASMTRQLLRAGLSFAVPLAYGVATGGIGGAAAPAAASPAAATTAAAPVAAAPAVAAPAAATAAAPAAAATTAAATSPSWLKSLLAPAIGGGLGLAGALIGAHEQSKATDAQAKAAEDAIALQREMYQQTRKDLEPYRQLGGSSSSSLGYLMGLPGYEGGPQPYAEPPPTPDTKTVIRAPLGSPVTVPSSSVTGTAVPRPGVTLVTLKRPDGQLISVNANLVDSYLQRGFTRV